MDTQDINAVALVLGIPAVKEDANAGRQLLIAAVNELIAHNFEKLVALLYRMDVSEHKIKTFLARHTDTDAAEIIVALMLERELEKRKSRGQYSRRDDTIDESERW